MKPIKIVTTILCLAMILSMGLILLLNWNSLPDKVPTHFAFDGTAEKYSGKAFLLVSPVMAAVMFALITVMQKFPKLWNFPVEITNENREREYLIAHMMLDVVKVMITALFLVSMLASMISGFPAWPITVLVAVMLASVLGGIVVMIRLK